MNKTQWVFKICSQINFLGILKVSGFYFKQVKSYGQNATRGELSSPRDRLRVKSSINEEIKQNDNRLR